MSLAIDQTIEGKKLEESQKIAIQKSGKNICVNAGAGSGKTLTIIGKIIHILDQKLAEPDNIVVVAYNNKVADNLRNRLKKLTEEHPNLKKKLERISISKDKGHPDNKDYTDRKVHTFHSYCLSQLKKNSSSSELASYLNSKENDILNLKKSNFFENLVQEIGENQNDFFKKINTFFLKYIQNYKNIFKDIHSMSDYNRMIKPRHASLKTVKEDKHEIPLEVKSIEELEIANFLYLKGIEFIYEDEFKGDLPPQWERWDRDNSRGYRPDFHIIKDSSGKTFDQFYEHFALDKNFDPPHYFRDRDKYKEDYEIKKNLFNGKLICTYSYQKIEGSLFDKLTEQLEAKGIKVPEENVISEEEALEKFKEAGYLNSFATLLANFVTNFKLRGADLDKLKVKVNSGLIKKLFENEGEKRERAFVEIFETVYNHYEKKLEELKQVDYEDMLLKGIDHINNQNIKYLIVDEFQDISPLRAEVIKKIQKTNENVKLFTVGDDWQAIYRFSGGDIKIIVKKYNKFFGKREMSNLNLTYRFNNRLSELTSSFILKNKKGQLLKDIKGKKDYNEIPLEIFEQTAHRSFKIDFSLKKHLLTKLDEIFKSDKCVEKILFLTRYRDYKFRNGYEDIKRYLTNIFKNKKIYKNGKNEDIIEFSTIHKAKGSEADYVFLMNVSDGYMGFPSTIENDPLLKLVIEDIDEFEYEEERRLFYVALTRTKKKVFIYGKKESYFIEEILNDAKIKKGHHYKNSEIPQLKNPDRVLVLYLVKGNKKKIDPQTPAKNAGLKNNDIITKVNDKPNPTKEDLKLALRDSNGDEIKLHIKNEEGKIEEKKIKPYNENEEKKATKRWSINAKYYEREIDPFIDRLMKDYSFNLNDKDKKKANLNNNK